MATDAAVIEQGTIRLQVAAARIHPTSGVAGILGEVMGAVDVFELRPRIGLASAAVADQVAANGPIACQAILRAWRETEGLPDVEAMQIQDKIG